MNGQVTKAGAKKVLVADDDPVIVKTLSRFLNENGYTALGASDGAGVARLVEREKPDLILLDIQFPPDAMNIGGALQDGFFIMEWIRRMGNAANIPIIIISVSYASKDRQRALEAGAVGYFTKPIDRPALLTTIRKVLGTNATDDVSRAA